MTIFNGTEGPAGAAGRIEVEGPGRAAIGQILRDHAGDAVDTGAWAEFCGESARVAHTVGENLKNNPGNMLAPPDTVDVWGRYIADRGVARGSGEFEARLGVMTWLSLFRSFGKGGDVARIRGLLAAKGAIPEGRFDPVLAKMRDRKIVRGGGDVHSPQSAARVPVDQVVERARAGHVPGRGAGSARRPL